MIAFPNSQYETYGPVIKCYLFSFFHGVTGNGTDTQWCFSQVKGTLDDEITDGKYISYFQHVLQTAACLKQLLTAQHEKNGKEDAST